MEASFISCFIVLAATIILGINAADGPVVDIQDGKLVGTTFRSQYSTNPVYAFLGVPYARPPVGDLRFALAQPVEPWTGTRGAREHGAACPQNEELLKMVIFPISLPETPMSEDCLHLDVYSPDLNGKRDVLVFIHGGGFIVGKNSMNNGTAVSAHGDVVFVSINYRLGFLGFLQNFSGNWPSNLGLRDQQFALRWVQDNIAAFGGDPNSVTIAGESAGATAVSIHVVAPSSRGLFHRAIVQSGSVFTTPSTSNVDLASMALMVLGCADLDPDETLVCLRNKSAEEFVKAGLPGAMMFEDDLLLKDPEAAYNDGKIANVDLLLGVVEDEGFINTGIMIPEMMSPTLDLKTFEEQLAAIIGMFYGNNVGEVYKEVVDYYFGGGISDKDDVFVRQRTAEMLGMMVLTAPTHLLAQYHSDNVENTYFYHFAHQPSFLVGLRPPWHSGGCDHGFELVYTLGMPLLGDFLPDQFKVTGEDVALSKIAMEYWTNFVKTGDPNGKGLPLWLPFTREGEDYIVIQPECRQASIYKADDLAFWNDKIRGLDKRTSQREEL